MVGTLDGGRAGRRAGITPVAAAACGVLLGAGLLLGLLGAVGGAAVAAVGLTPLPVVPGLLFAHPVLVPAATVGPAIGLVVGADRVVRDRGWAAAACGLVGLSMAAVVAASAANVLLSIVRALP